MKSSLGDVWHLSSYGGKAAHCDHRIALHASDCRTALTADGPSDVYCCKRCQAIATALDAKQN